jgi:RNA 3'-terminal phosphate cyclase (ATP)
VREGVEIDGSRGEGGGQILRTSLALSMITGKPLVMTNIRAGRAKPGLRRQHLACVHAAQQLSNAEVYGAEVGSKFLDFRPRGIETRALDIDIGSAGSTTLVVQTILVAAIVAKQPLRAVVHGGTHNPMAPPFEFLSRVFLPHLVAMGARVTLELDRHGFASGGGRASHDELTQYRGQLTLVVEPGQLRPIEVVEAAPIRERHATAILARLPTHVAERELDVVREQLGWSKIECEVRDVSDAGGPANVLMLEVDRDASREVVTGIGEKGLRAEVVAERACRDMQAYLDADVPVGEHLADQLLLPLALAGGGKFRAATLSLHSTTNIETIRAFIDVPMRTEDVRDGVVDVIVG